MGGGRRLWWLGRVEPASELTAPEGRGSKNGTSDRALMEPRPPGAVCAGVFTIGPDATHSPMCRPCLAGWRPD
jgi:hypothetical protein